jgi:hypothetical protein
LISNRPTRANNFRRDRPSTPYKLTDADRIKALESMFLLTEKEMNNFYRAFCHMAKRKVQSQRKSRSKRIERPASSSADKSPLKPSRPWEDNGSNATLTLKAFFSAFNLPNENGGFYDAIFELVGIKNFHSMTFW